MQSNHPDLIGKNSTHLAISVMVLFEKVRRRSMCLNHPELVHKLPAHLVSPVTMWIERFGAVEPPRTHWKKLYTPCYICNDVDVHVDVHDVIHHVVVQDVLYGRVGGGVKEGGGVCMCRRGVKIGRMGKEEEKGQQKMWGGGGGK